jgi:hypothetical protein
MEERERCYSLILFRTPHETSSHHHIELLYPCLILTFIQIFSSVLDIFLELAEAKRNPIVVLLGIHRAADPCRRAGKQIWGEGLAGPGARH